MLYCWWILLSTPILPPPTGNDTSNIDFPKEINKQSALVVLSEGLPPISTKLLENIQQWEFVDLTSLLSGDPSTSKNDTVTFSHEGQQIVGCLESVEWTTAMEY